MKLFDALRCERFSFLDLLLVLTFTLLIYDDSAIFSILALAVLALIRWATSSK